MQGSFTADSASKFLQLMADEGYEVSALNSNSELENFSGQGTNRTGTWNDRYPDFSDLPGEYIEQQDFLEGDHSISAHKDTVGEVMHRWKHHDPMALHSGRGKGGKEGKVVTDQKQAIAIALSIAEKKGKYGKGMGKPKRAKKAKAVDHAEISQDFSEFSIDELLNFIRKPFSYAEEDGEQFDFTRCERHDGSAYGTGGRCRKGFQRERDDKYPFEAAVTQGRFNIPHKGHAKLIKKMLEKAPMAYVVLGTGEKNVNRDFRSQMLRAMLRKEGVDLSRVKIMQGTHINAVIKDLSNQKGSRKIVAMLGEDQKSWLKRMGKDANIRTQVIPRTESGASSSAIRKMVDSNDETALNKEFDNDPYLIRLAKVARKVEKNEFSEFDFTRCERPDGSAYGTKGKCRKGTESEAPFESDGGITTGASGGFMGGSLFGSKGSGVATAIGKSRAQELFSMVSDKDGAFRKLLWPSTKLTKEHKAKLTELKTAIKEEIESLKRDWDQLTKEEKGGFMGIGKKDRSQEKEQLSTQIRTLYEAATAINKKLRQPAKKQTRELKPGEVVGDFAESLKNAHIS